MTPRHGMRYVRPDGSGARVVLVEDGVAWLYNGGATLRRLPASGYALDWSDGATLGAVEHDVLGPAGWWVERSEYGYRPRCGSRFGVPWRCSLAEALRDALEVIDG